MGRGSETKVTNKDCVGLVTTSSTSRGSTKISSSRLLAGEVNLKVPTVKVLSILGVSSLFGISGLSELNKGNTFASALERGALEVGDSSVFAETVHHLVLSGLEGKVTNEELSFSVSSLLCVTICHLFVLIFLSGLLLLLGSSLLGVALLRNVGLLP